MNRITATALFLTLMLLTDAISAQVKNKPSLHWKVAATLPAQEPQKKSLGIAGPVTGVHKQALIIAGGANFPDSMPWLGGKKKYYDAVYVYEKKGKHIQLHKGSFKLPSAIAYAASCSTPLGIVYAGGENETGISNAVFLLQWNNNTHSLDIKKLPDLPVPLTNAAASADGNTIYIAGGENNMGVSGNFYMLDMNSSGDTWKTLPALPMPVSHAVMVKGPGTNHPALFVIGGRKKNTSGISDLYSSVLTFDITTGQWQEKRSLPFALSAATGVATGGYILIFGGDKGTTFHQVETLIAEAALEKNEIKKQELVNKKNQLLIHHPGFNKEVLCYTVATGEWTTIGTIPFDTPATTTAVMWNDDIFIPSGEIRAGLRTPQILMAKRIAE